MEPPLPGMDPYLEDLGLWPDVHHRLITVFCDQINVAQRLDSRRHHAYTPYRSVGALR
jgi:hypothetical protein